MTKHCTCEHHLFNLLRNKMMIATVAMRQDKMMDEYNSRPHGPRVKSEVRTEENGDSF